MNRIARTKNAGKVRALPGGVCVLSIAIIIPATALITIVTNFSPQFFFPKKFGWQNVSLSSLVLPLLLLVVLVLCVVLNDLVHHGLHGAGSLG